MRSIYFKTRITIIFSITNSVRKSKRHCYTITARAKSDCREVKEKFRASASDQHVATAAAVGVIMRLQKRHREFFAECYAQRVTSNSIRDSAASAGGNVRILDINIVEARSELL